jgi:hypothetical protein
MSNNRPKQQSIGKFLKDAVSETAKDTIYKELTRKGSYFSSGGKERFIKTILNRK